MQYFSNKRSSENNNLGHEKIIIKHNVILEHSRATPYHIFLPCCGIIMIIWLFKIIT
jgi:hypothetical protein